MALFILIERHEFYLKGVHILTWINSNSFAHLNNNLSILER